MTRRPNHSIAVVIVATAAAAALGVFLGGRLVVVPPVVGTGRYYTAVVSLAPFVARWFA